MQVRSRKRLRQVRSTHHVNLKQIYIHVSYGVQLASLRLIRGYCCSSIRRLQKLKGLDLSNEPLPGCCELTLLLMRTDAGQSEQRRRCASLLLSQYTTESIWVEVTSIIAVSRPNTSRTPSRRPVSSHGTPSYEQVPTMH